MTLYYDVVRVSGKKHSFFIDLSYWIFEQSLIRDIPHWHLDVKWDEKILRSICSPRSLKTSRAWTVPISDELIKTTVKASPFLFLLLGDVRLQYWGNSICKKKKKKKIHAIIDVAI